MSKKRKLVDESLNDPLRTLAQGLFSERSEQTWVDDTEPVDIVEFVEGRLFLNQKWNGRTGCRPKILEYLVETLDPDIREAIWLLGKGSGKDFGASILHLYGIYRCLKMVNPQSYFGLVPSPIYFVNTARNETQAKRVFFTQFLALLKECPWFDGKYREPGVQSVEFQKNIYALSTNSQAFGWLGYNTIQWVGDELAFFLEKDFDDESESRAKICWEAAFGSCKTRFPKDYKMIGITTPRYDDDFVMRKYYELQNRSDGLVKRAATWEVNPNLKKEDFKFEFIRDYRRTMRDFGAEPSGIIESFWPEPDFVENSVCEECRQCPIYKNKKLGENIFECWDYEDCKGNAYKGNGEWRKWFLPPVENNEYVMHFDLAKSKDRIGFSLGYSNGDVQIELDAYKIKEREDRNEIIKEEDKFETKPLIKISAIGFVTVTERDKGLLKNNEFYYSAIMSNCILNLEKRGFNIIKITFDTYQSHYIKQELEDRGIDTDLISLDRTDEIPVAAKYALTEQRVEYPYCRLLVDEARNLKFIAGKKVDHARRASKDAWDGFAGTIYNCEKELGNRSVFGMIAAGSEDD